MTRTLVVAALSARMMAESARDGGFEVVALDVFGDEDTRDAAASWHAAGRGLALDGGALLRALSEAALDRRCVGWVAGSGFEARPALLARAAKILPLIGNPPETVQALRSPRRFFATLDALGIAHPEVAWTPPADPEGWLWKDACSSGGAGVRAASSAVGRARGYFQRVQRGASMSVLAVANGSAATIAGVNRLLSEPHGSHPARYAGAIGGIALPGAVDAELRSIVDRVVAAWGLRGLFSVDFMLDGDDIAVLEINARPSATMALYRDRWGDGLMRAHLTACLDRALPDDSTACPAAGAPRGERIVYLSHSLEVSAALAAALAARGDCRDRPRAGAAIPAGGPLCSVAASGESVDVVGRALAARATAVRRLAADARSKALRRRGASFG